MSLTVACVLRSGGSYGPEDVWKLQRGVARHLKQPYDFVCLTDHDGVVGSDLIVEELQYGWPGWWSKIELFRPYVFHDRVLYLDLDTIVQRDIGWAVREVAQYWDDLDAPCIAMLQDARHPVLRGSGVMYWREPRLLDHIFCRFRGSPDTYMRKFSQMPYLGDQAFVVEAIAHAGQAIGTWPAETVGCLNVDTEAQCRGATFAFASWVPKLGEMAEENSWRGELVRESWR